MTITKFLTKYSGNVPNRSGDTPILFADNVYNYQIWIDTHFVGELNDSLNDINLAIAEVKTVSENVFNQAVDGGYSQSTIDSKLSTKADTTYVDTKADTTYVDTKADTTYVDTKADKKEAVFTSTSYVQTSGNLAINGNTVDVTNGVFTYAKGHNDYGFKRDSDTFSGSIDFTGVSDGYKWVAKDENDNFSFYDNKPSVGNPNTTGAIYLEDGTLKQDNNILANQVSFLNQKVQVASETPQTLEDAEIPLEVVEGALEAGKVVAGDIEAGKVVAGDIEAGKVVAGDIVSSGKYIGKNACTAWVNFDGTTTPPTIRDSFNVKDVVRTDTGKFYIYFEEDMDNLNYSLSAISGCTSGNIYWVGEGYSGENEYNTGRTLSNCQTYTTKADNFDAADTIMSVQIFGGKE